MRSPRSTPARASCASLTMSRLRWAKRWARTARRYSAAQIGETIEAHFRKQRRVRESGVKVLSLFFIDRVENYVADDGVIRRLFDEEFKRLATRFPEWSGVETASVRAAYFAERRHKGGGARGRRYERRVARRRRRLRPHHEGQGAAALARRAGALSSSRTRPCAKAGTTPTSSRSARSTRPPRRSRSARRSAVACGLPSTRAGERLHDEQLNVLTVVANESYETLRRRAATRDRGGVRTDGTPPPPPRADRPKAVLRKERALSPEFKELWEQDPAQDPLPGAHRQRAADRRRQPRLGQARRRGTASAHLACHSRGGGRWARGEADGPRMGDEVRPETLPNLLALIEGLLEFTTPPMRLRRSFTMT